MASGGYSRGPGGATGGRYSFFGDMEAALGPTISRAISYQSKADAETTDKYEKQPEALDAVSSSDEERDAEAGPSRSRRNSQSMIPSRANSHMVIAQDDLRELQRIATAMSGRRASTPGDGMSRAQSYIDFEHDPELDPESKNFNLTKWLKAIISRFDDQGMKLKHAGVVYKDLNVSGSGAALQLQSTIGTVFESLIRPGELLSFAKKEHKQILQNFDGILESGEMLIVLGRPGSGCSTLLKTICGELHGLQVDDGSTIHYNGIPQQQMMKEFKGEAMYNQEVDKHFPHLTVGQTLEFAASARTPSQRVEGVSRKDFAQHMAKVVMATVGLSHTYNTKVGDDFIRGVSGGERKRVSIAEMILAGSPFSAWDNSTRGLDSATALKFVQALRMGSDLGQTTNAVAIYQASQAIYDTFDKATVLYEGRQIYFGPAEQAKEFFERQGWYCPTRQTTGDFLTSVTNPSERKPREDMENQVPRTPQEFEKYWRESPEFQALQEEIKQHEQKFPIDNEGPSVQALREQKNLQQAKHVRPQSPFLISIPMQIRLNTIRAYQRIWNDISATATQIAINLIIALIVGSIFYGTPDATAGFFSRGSVIFLAILMNALTAISEINSLYAQRPIVEKHASYAFYHPATEAIAGVVAQIPIKFASAVVFNVILYFMAGLRREAGPFFLYFLITYIATFVMVAIFRTMAAITKTISQAMALAGILVLALVVYTGFTISTPLMKPWFGWIRWINPIYYAFEILIANEFHGREFPCSSLIPAYQPPVGNSYICGVVGAVAGELTVSGDAFIAQNYQYYYSHVWRNFGILLAFLFGFMILYFIASELNASTSSTAEVLVFQKGHVPSYLQKGNSTEEDVVAEKSEEKAVRADSSDATEINAIEPQKDIFTWQDVVYDIEIKGEPRRLLDHASGWVKPGTLTALMGVSGAGKTTLLDALAQRTTMGVITGHMLVNGKPLDPSFQRNTGYVQQQDLHLETATVRESLRFSALLRQPKSVSTVEKYEFVEEVIKMLGMADFANAVVGVPGQGLNVEQRKLLTIGVELAAKPKLLLFLDEPTSGLDSQSSWSIVSFLRKLADSGQAILCTVHQPSAILFQEFDRLLFLAKGGRTVYFGPVGKHSRQLLDYFESNGARKCSDQENPAEYMLEIVNNGTNDKGEEWPLVWNNSNNFADVQQEIQRICTEENKEPESSRGAESHTEFAMPLTTQIVAVTVRVFQQYWRMPSYIISKIFLGTVAGLFIGFSFFQGGASLAGLQNIIFSVFMLTTIFSTLVQQIQPLFISQRSLYEVRERPSKAYSWVAFMLANIVVEIPWQILTGIMVFASFYYPVTGIQDSERQGLVLLFVIQLFLYASTFAQMTIAAFPDAETASGLVTMLTLMSTMFCGVLQGPNALPGFWIFMYRVSPFTYWIGGIASTQLHARIVDCSETETSIFDPPDNQTCGDYMAQYLSAAPGTLQNPDDTAACRFCSISNGDQYLASSNIFWTERWRNFGIMFAFIGFNLFVAVASYYVFRVAKWGKGGKKDGKGKKEKKQDKEQSKV